MIAKYHTIKVVCSNPAAANGYQQVMKRDNKFGVISKSPKELCIESGKSLTYMIKS